MSGYNEDQRFKKPWAIIEHPESFEIRTANGIRIAFVYFEDEKSRADLNRRPNKKQALARAGAMLALRCSHPYPQAFPQLVQGKWLGREGSSPLSYLCKRGAGVSEVCIRQASVEPRILVQIRCQFAALSRKRFQRQSRPFQLLL